jgi:hypothetical protein
MPYTERYVAFVDILGFSTIVNETVGDSARFDSLLTVLETIGIFVRGLPATADSEFQAFSDSIVVSTNACPPGLTMISEVLTNLALGLMPNGYLVRGAIAKGKLYHKGSVMFGPAFLEAYSIEQSVARFPRIILSQQVYEDVKRLRKADPAFLLADDGPPYLHVLAPLIKVRKPTIKTPTADCLSAIQKLLNQSIHNPQHYEKLRWLALYWNGTVGREVPAFQVRFPDVRG